MLTNVDYEKLLDFSMNLSKKKLLRSSNSIEAVILELLDRMFDFKLSAFTKFNDMSSNNLTNGGVVRDIIGHNISDDLLKDYSRYYVRTDLFIVNKYKIQMLGKKNILSTNDICSYEDYEKSEYYKFLSRARLYYQMVLNIDDSGDVINIFKKKEEGCFTAREHMIINKIYDIVTDKYNLIKSADDLTEEINTLKTITQTMPFALLVFDEKLNLLDFNKLAIQYCSNITKKYFFDDIIANFKSLLFEIIKQNKKNNEKQRIHTPMSCNHTIIDNYIIVASSINKLTSDNAMTKNNIVYIYDRSWTKSSDSHDGFVSKYDLTKREIEVSELICKGLSNREISEQLIISPNTVKTHIDNIFKKLGVKNRASVIFKLKANK